MTISSLSPLANHVLERTMRASAPNTSAGTPAAPAASPTAPSSPTPVTREPGVNRLAEGADGLTRGPAPTADQQRELKRLKEAAESFEAIFIRDLLGSTNLAGGSDYGKMANDALAESISRGSGLGLARQIEETLVAVQFPALAKPQKPGT
ncbi:MAG: hypothetical protein AAGA56_17600 [Myxococcota bacterium]